MIKSYWETYWSRWFRLAVDKPRLTSISREVAFLIFFLCLFSIKIGVWMGHGEAGRSGMANLDILICGMIVTGWLASEFRWSLGTTIFLRLSTLAMMISLFVALFR